MDDKVSAAVQSILFVVKQEVAFCRIFQSVTDPNHGKIELTLDEVSSD